MRAGWLMIAVCVACGGTAPVQPPLIPEQPPPIVPIVEAPVVARDHIVRGHVLGANGEPLVLAHAHLLGPGGENKPLHSVQASADGSFTLSLVGRPAEEGLARVQFSGVDHRVETVVVALDEAVDVEVRLGTYHQLPPSAPQYQPALLVSGPGSARARHALQRQSDGTFATEVALPDDTYGYEIGGTNVEIHTVNGTTTEDDTYVYDDDGDYWSRVNVKGGKLRVVFDPSKVPPSGLDGSAKLADEGSASAVLSALYRSDDQQNAAWRSKATPDARAEALSQGIGALEQRSKSPLVRQAASIAYFHERGENARAFAKEEKARADKIIDEAASSGPIFTLFPEALPRILKAASSPKGDALRRTIIDTHPSASVVAALLLATLRAKTATIDEQRAIVQLLRTDRFRSTTAPREADVFDPDRVIGPGKAMPAFDLKALAANGKPITPKSLRGKVYLVDLWATWCKPCVAELPRMHKLFADYGPDAKTTTRTKTFQIVSVAFDDKPETVIGFRNDKAHPMPWLQAFAGPPASATATLETLTGKPTVGIPFYVLVDDKGKIVASSPELKLSDVPAMLDQLLR